MAEWRTEACLEEKQTDSDQDRSQNGHLKITGDSRAVEVAVIELLDDWDCMLVDEE